MKKSERKADGKCKGLGQATKRRMYVHMIVLVLLTIGVFTGMALFIFPQQAHRGAVHRTTGGQGISSQT